MTLEIKQEVSENADTAAIKAVVALMVGRIKEGVMEGDDSSVLYAVQAWAEELSYAAADEIFCEINAINS